MLFIVTFHGWPRRRFLICTVNILASQIAKVLVRKTKKNFVFEDDCLFAAVLKLLVLAIGLLLSSPERVWETE